MSAADDDTLNAAVDAVTSDALAALGAADAPAADDPQPAPKRRSRSGTSRAQRKAKAEAGGSSSSSPAPAKPRATRTPAKPRVNIAQSMAQLYTLAGVGVSMAPPLDPLVRQAVGQALATQADACGEAWATLARENERVRRALESLLTVSSVGVLLAAHVPIVLAGVQASAAARELAAQVPAA